MAKEALYIPEQHLREVIEIIRAGLEAHTQTTPEVREALESWCNKEQQYADEYLE